MINDDYGKVQIQTNSILGGENANSVQSEAVDVEDLDDLVEEFLDKKEYF